MPLPNIFGCFSFRLRAFALRNVEIDFQRFNSSRDHNISKGPEDKSSKAFLPNDGELPISVLLFPLEIFYALEFSMTMVDMLTSQRSQTGRFKKFEKQRRSNRSLVHETTKNFEGKRTSRHSRKARFVPPNNHTISNRNFRPCRYILQSKLQ